jgi:ATP-dependent helicase/nuclease subunit B
MAASGRPSETPPRLRGLLPAGASISVSQLEQYARCSFAWFVTYALAPMEWKSYRVALSDAGTYVHAAAAAFGSRLLSAPDPAVLSDELAESLMDGVVDGLVADVAGALTDDGHGRWMAGRIRAACRLAARRFLEQMRQGSFRPRYYEAEFGPGGRFPLIPAGSDSGVSLRGFVDRVDAYPTAGFDYLRVIDYKTGDAKLDPAGAMDGYQVQLWIYLRALCDGWRQVAGRPARPAGLFYFPVRDEYIDDRDGDPESARAKAARMNGLCLDDPVALVAMDRDLALPDARSSIVGVRTGKNGAPCGAVRSAAEMEAVGRGVMDTVAGMVRSIREGRVEAVPLKIGQRLVCAGCPYRPICGVFGAVRYRKPSSREAVAAWTERYLREVCSDD